MTSTIPQLSRPTTSPPSTVLPPLPTAKPKRSPLGLADAPKFSASNTSLSKLRTPSSSFRTPSSSTFSSSTFNSSNGSGRSPSMGQPPNSPEKPLRRVASMAAFPQPLKAGARPSPGSSSSTISNLPAVKSSSSDSVTRSSSLRSKKTPRISTGVSNYSRGSRTPTLLDGSGEGNSIPNTKITRNPEAHSLVHSPTPSRSSSAQGSTYSTSATTFDDCDDSARKSREGPDGLPGASRRTSKIKEGKGNVIVSVRVRPDSANNDSSKTEGEWLVDGRRCLVSYRGREGGDYFYDNVFATHDNNAKVYDACAKRLVRRVMEGYHGTVFAYGMTGTGKTFSMQGTATSPGVIPLAITDIFSYIRETPHREFLLRVSYLEIYNEKIHDLLSMPPSAGPGPGTTQQEEIKLREDSKRGVYATPLKEEIVQSPTQLLRVIARGDHARRTGSTQFNARSSRSHAVVQIVVESRERASTSSSAHEKRTALVPGGVRVSTLSLIDLAGSERAAENKERRTEGAHINKSLLTLGTVIARLSGDKDKNANTSDRDGKHLPYRDSKLTRLLQPALSGNSLVSILCTIQIGSAGSAAAANTHTNETLNTLKFAARAKNNIVSHAKRAEEALGGGAGDAGSRVLLERYRMEIQSLRTQLDKQAKTHLEQEPGLDERRFEKEAETRHEEQMLEMQLARTALKERIEHLNRLILCSKSTGVNANGGFSMMSFPQLRGFDSRSLRSSGSQSTLGGIQLNRSGSMTSVRSSGGAPLDQYQPFGNNDDEEDTIGEFADGTASLQAQINALQADLADKNRYISTLERRLLQARRSSHSRMSVGLSQLKAGGTSPSDPEVAGLLREKDMEIADLRLQLDDKDRMVAALRSAARQREIAQLAAESLPPDPPKPPSVPLPTHRPNHQSSESNSSSIISNTVMGAISPVNLLSPTKIPEKDNRDKKRRSVDEMSRMLDEMIQDRVESGHLVKGVRGSVRLANGLRREESLEIASAPPPNVAATIGGTLVPPRGPVADLSSPQEMTS
ncbi:Kinesin-like protein kip2 [Emydomyces testavorans]|uniref:Kinesin-like protein KIP2 n=1 Tax=Emydomyces testavorans TaxID=2070801 RepID=A0AAF0IMR8_9EURO|nr:Kinesin-like protein kip2 [Emydomyces testavorans]